MPVLVQVENFQSIKKAEVLVDGLTVVTGTNNCGKTSIMRAIRGVFTNPAAGPLIRHGEAYLSVTLTFDDGTKICWEKGWEKPFQKGKGINRYIINGLVIQGVGRGVPPEVESLGIRDIQASSERVWPQIADQFDGTLFLLNRPGSAVAEALSDVEKVGKLTDALKLSERDCREAEQEVKVRRRDLEAIGKEVAFYAGFEDVRDTVADLHGKRSAVSTAFQETEAARALKVRLDAAKGSAAALAGFSPHIPSEGQGASLRDRIVVVDRLQRTLREAREGARTFRDFRPDLPPVGEAAALGAELRAVRSLRSRHQAAVKSLDAYREVPEVNFADLARLQKIQSVRLLVSGFQKSLREATEKVAQMTSLFETTSEELRAAEVEVTTLLGDRGCCPTCGALHTGEHAHV